MVANSEALRGRGEWVLDEVVVRQGSSEIPVYKAPEEPVPVSGNFIPENHPDVIQEKIVQKILPAIHDIVRPDFVCDVFKSNDTLDVEYLCLDFKRKMERILVDQELKCTFEFWDAMMQDYLIAIAKVLQKEDPSLKPEDIDPILHG